jgi:Ca2+-dependent lipid-binding protein
VTLGKQKKESKVIYNSLNPVWNEELLLDFHVPQDFDHRLKVEVVDWDPPPKSHDPLGHIEIPLQHLRHHNEMQLNEMLIDGDRARIELVITLLQ